MSITLQRIAAVEAIAMLTNFSIAASENVLPAGTLAEYADDPFKKMLDCQ